MKLLTVLGRAMFAAIFLMSGPGHFTSRMAVYAGAQGTPMPGVLVPLSGVLAIAGGLSILLGYKARWGAWLIVLFLVPVTLVMHRFWGLSDPAAAMMQQVQFMKNVSMCGAALVFTQLGSGPASLKA